MVLITIIPLLILGVIMFVYALLSCGVTHRRTLRAIFRKYDEDGSGEISREEMKATLRHFMPEASEETCEEIVEKLDENHDGTISFEEFVTA
jgi:Ca2+-binding EF-hand superfamily protein